MNTDDIVNLVVKFAQFSAKSANVNGNSLIDFVGWLKNGNK